MSGIAERLAAWAGELRPSPADVALADRALADTVAVTLAAHDQPIARLAAGLPDAARWAAVGHVLDYDDVHLPSTAHVSVVCVAATLATGGDARAYLAGAGVMARLGETLGWAHYARGWHATCTAGAPAAAVAAGVALGLDVDALAHAMALAVPAAGGVQRAFGTDAKCLQVGFAAQAGVRAAELVAAGARADPRALDEWAALLGGDPARLRLDGPAVPDGLAIKLHPCCYALQRPIAAVQALPPIEAPAERVTRIHVRTPAATLQPLVHNRPRTGLEGKFSLEYAIAAALLDGFPGFASFTDGAVQRETAQALVGRVEVDATHGGEAGLLDGDLTLTVDLVGGERRSATVALPPGAPARPPTPAELAAKFAGCGADVPARLADLSWASARAVTGW